MTAATSAREVALAQRASDEAMDVAKKREQAARSRLQNIDADVSEAKRTLKSRHEHLEQAKADYQGNEVEMQKITKIITNYKSAVPGLAIKAKVQSSYIPGKQVTSVTATAAVAAANTAAEQATKVAQEKAAAAKIVEA